MDDTRYAEAIRRFDAANADDPRRAVSDGGVPEPKELVYSRRLTAMIDRFAPNASEVVRLAARCQHIRRWEIPRSTYPRSTEGYREWRQRLFQHHAEIASAILRDVGYDETVVETVVSLIRKERLKRNPESQLLEDLVGLLFLEHYLAGFVADHPEYRDAKLLDILTKTLRKMSQEGRAAATTLVKIPPGLAPMVERAVAAASVPTTAAG